MLNVIIYTAVLFTIVSLAYLYIGLVKINLSLNPQHQDVFNRIKGANYFFKWLVLYTNIDYWGKGYDSLYLVHNYFKGLSTCIYQPVLQNNQKVFLDFSHLFSLHSFIPFLLFIFCISVILIFLTRFKSIFKYEKPVFWASLLFSLIYTAFFLWWEPDYREFWLAPLLSYYILSFLLFNQLTNGTHWKNKMAYAIVTCFIFLMAFMLFVHNFQNFIYEQASHKYRVFDMYANKYGLK